MRMEKAYRSFGYWTLISGPQNLAKKARENYCNFVIFYSTINAKTGINQIEINKLKLFKNESKSINNFWLPK